jgi:hypothetical protein
MNAYQEGIAARKQGLGHHENPFIGEEGNFVDFLFSPLSYKHPVYYEADWDKGWCAENSWQASHPQ